jgi:hypothetical protein
MKKPKKRRELTIKERRFVNEYLKSGNATQSVIRAGYEIQHPRQAGYELKNRENIKEQIDIALTKLDITPDKLLMILQQIGDKGENDIAKLNTVKYLFELMGWDKEKAQKVAQKIIINIDKGVIPVNLRQDDSVNLANLSKDKDSGSDNIH